MDEFGIREIGVIRPSLGTYEYKGTFVTFEGGEGCGKTTQANLLKEYLEGTGKEVVVTREPGGTWLGEKVRDILLGHGQEEIAPITEALLFAADRSQQVRDIIRPALERGAVVIGDRYTDSSMAYQGVGRGCGLEAVKNLNDWATGELEPTITVFLDLAVKKGLERVAEDPDRIEQESIEFHENVRHAYSMLLRIFSYRMVVIDANGTPEMVHDRVVTAVSKVLR